MGRKILNMRAPRGHWEKRKQYVHDCYETPTGAVRALRRREPLWGEVIDPCCGQGVICRELLRADPDLDIVGCDLRRHAHIWGWYGVDFLRAAKAETEPVCDFFVLNPPFMLAQVFAEECLRLSRVGVYLFQRTNWIEGIKRYRELWCNAPLARLYVFASRVNCYPEGEVSLDCGGSMCFAWYVFRHDHVGPPTLHWIDDTITMVGDSRIGIDDALEELTERKRTKLMSIPTDWRTRNEL